jgi:hypothetical protein
VSRPRSLGEAELAAFADLFGDSDKERLESPSHDIRQHAGSGIDYGDPYLIIWIERAQTFDVGLMHVARHDAQPTTRRHCVSGIDGKVGRTGSSCVGLLVAGQRSEADA